MIGVGLLGESETDDLHDFYFTMVDAARNDDRDLNLPMSYSEELGKYSFINISEKTFSLFLDRIQPMQKLHENIIRNWSEGFEAWSLELIRQSGKFSLKELFHNCTGPQNIKQATLRSYLSG